MKQEDKYLFKRLLQLDPVHQDVPVELEEAYDKYVEVCKVARTNPTFHDQVLIATLFSSCEPVEIKAGKAIAEGEAVQVMGDNEYRGKLGKVVEIAGGSEEGLARVKIKYDRAKYREIPLENLRIIA